MATYGSIYPQPDTVSLDPTPAPTETVSLDNGVEAPRPVPPTVATPRAMRAEIGIGKLTGKSFEEIYNNLTTGGENNLRMEAAAAVDREKAIHRNRTIIDIAKQQGGAVTPDQISHIDATLKSLNDPTASNSVFEEYFSKEYLDLVKKTGEVNPDSSMYAAIKEIPKAVDRLQEGTSEILTKRLFAETAAENMESRVEKQSIPGYVADLGKSLIPFYGQWRTSGLVPGVSALQGRGSQWEAQAKALWALPTDEFKARVTEIADNIGKDNPQLAAEFLRAIAGQSTSDLAIGNLFTAIDVTAIKPLALAAGAKTLLTRRLGLYGEAQRSYKAMLDAATHKGTLEARPAMLDASGNFKEAGVQEFTIRTAKELSGEVDPASAVRPLPPALRAELTEREANVGSHSREVVNRINETTAKNSFLLTNAVENIMKVERTPALVALEKVARAALEKFKEDYLGHFITAEKVVAGPAGTNTKFFRADMLMPDGSLFPKESSAKMYAVQNGIALQGEDPVKLLELQTKIKIAEGQLQYFHMAAAKADEKLPVKLGQAYPFPSVTAPEFLTAANKSPNFLKNLDALEDKIAGYKTELENIKNRPGARVVAPDEKANGYVIQFTKPLNETDPLIRSSLQEAPGAPAPQGWLNSLIGRFRTPEDILSVNQRENRKVATYSPSILREAAAELGKDIEKLAKWTLPFTGRRERWKDFERFLDSTRNFRDPVTGEPGYLPRLPGEVDVLYQQYVGRLPDAQELKAFFGYKDLVEMHDTLYRNTMYSKMSRVGTQTHNFSLIDDAGKRIKGPDFNGSTQNTMPGGDVGVLVVGKDMNSSYVYYGGNLGPKQAKQLKEGVLGKTVKYEDSEEYKAFIDSGEQDAHAVARTLEDRVVKGEIKVVKLYDDSARPFRDFPIVGDKRIQYVLTDTLETRPLSWDQVPRRRGGFFDTDYEHYLAQPIIKREAIGKELRHWYEGDRIIMPVAIRAMGRDVEKKLNNIRELIRDNKIDEARVYTQDNLPIAFDELHSWFKESLNSRGVRMPPALSMDEPIRLAQRNKLIGHTDNALRDKYEAIQKGSFKDGTRYGYMNKEVEEALFQSTFKDEGTTGNPLYKVAPVRYIDPMSNMNRALSKVINTSAMEDYKIFSVEHWIQDAAKYLKASEAELAHSPYWHFFSPEFQDGAPKDVVARIKTHNYQKQQLLGIPSDTDGILHSLAQQLHDSVYVKFGSRTADLLTPTWLLPKLKDPFAFLRSMAFHAKLGLFNVPQLLVQSQTFVNIMGVAGIKYAAPGTKAALLHQWARVNSNPEILQSLDNLATKQIIPGTSRWRPGEWLEAFTYGKHSGFFNVAGEYAARDDLYSSRVITTGKRQVLDWGSAPFREGEKAVRAGAWYTAFKEFRDLHPTGRVTEQDLKGILNRADLLTVNMSRASNSALHTGIMSIPTQFLSYQIRTFEQFLGKRLTPIEKARLFGTYAVVYGVPTAFGVTGLPLGDLLRKDALEKGYVVGDRWIESAVNEGIPSMLLALATGAIKGDINKGNWYNISERYGIQGFSTIREAMRSDQPWWKVFGGAAFSTIAGTIESTDGFVHAVMSGIRADGKFPFKIDDVIDPFKEIASVNGLWKVGMAIHTGRWMSKKEGFVDRDITAGNAIFMGLTGLQSQRATDVNLVTWSQHNQKDLEKEGLNRFVREFRRAQLALKDGNEEQHLDYMKRAFTFLRITGYPQDKYDKAIGIAADGYESMIERLDYSFYFDEAPDAVKKIRQQAYQKILQQRRLMRTP